MRYIQPRESSRLLEAVVKITEVYYSTPRSAKTKKDYTALVEAALVKISDIAFTAIDEINESFESEKPNRC